MSLPTLVEVCISMAFLYLVLSLMCTTVNEMIATYMKLRSKDLSGAIISLVDHPDVLTRFYKHGLIKNAIKAANRSDATTPMIDVTMPNGAGENKIANIPPATSHSSYLDGQSFAMALLGSLQPGTPIPVIEGMQGTVQALPDGSVKDIVGTALATADNDINKLRDNIAESFDSVMDRLSGEYKRKTRFISVLVGIGIAVVVNADSLAVSQAIWRDSDLRDQTVAAAEEFVKAQYGKAVELCNVESKDTTTETSPPDSPPDATIDFAATTNCVADKLAMLDDQLKPFPIGWGNVGSLTAWEWAAKPFGLFWTGLALSLGAPFWFDILQKFINFRGAGTKPETTKEKKEKEVDAKVSDGQAVG
ncbi:hypothetical protein HFO38_15660 [Rhizobium leguminosarum]|uniref:hypothetical protein n=1 Tax=Rhizobium leguminosarum TaxID=384 RepID=UPI001C97694D|nr:hypothetical protein [Rhizobium leguminosarum]MBY5704145.1 hypothetical protein [Rhizobium leguminosarum]